MVRLGTPRERIRILSLLFIIISAVSLTWSLIQCFTNRFDVGVFGFLSTLIAGWLALRVEQSPNFVGAYYAGYAVRISALFVICSYAMALVFDDRLVYQIYSGGAALLWAIGGWLLTRELWRADELTPGEPSFVYTNVPQDDQ